MKSLEPELSEKKSLVDGYSNSDDSEDISRIFTPHMKKFFQDESKR
jgi:hypothetical protein